MAMELKQSLKLSQQLVMTPQLQQAIKLLQLSRMELLEQVREEMEQNPLLEQPDEQAVGDVTDKEPGEASLEAENLEAPRDLEAPQPETAQEFKPENSDGPPEIDWEAYLNSYQFNEQTTASNKGNVATDDLPSFEANLVEKEDLVDHLQEQLGTLRLNEAERRIGMLILGNLDDDGYLKLPDVEGDPLIRLANEADVPMHVAERTLRRIQSLDPKGCGARDLQECLLIQVTALKDPHSALLGTIIKRHMRHLESKNLPAIAKELKVSLDEVVAAAKLLTKLDPKPGRNFSGDDAQYISPDVFVYKMGEEYTVVLNDDGLSKLRISGTYRNALKNGAVGPGQTKDFIQDKLRSAMWLIRSIHQRQRTIYKVTESIVKFQKDFFDKGIAHLKPLILRDVAEDIGMHESTVSRVTTAKYVHTPQGIFELKYFFNSSIARVSGEDTASEAVKHHIKQLVAQEDPKNPYSDQKLVELLRAQGTEIARRTVAKYREVLGILPSSKRKRYF
ncbi:RNA polymerase factor sigma-54 [Aggregicoccus sp. 17bor-14]|uniref:RNA polymerase factor sigma-54 n=1 Tax=Myxococcaceae TaxID=31 RepID=UPI00129D089F|nr:MULTISPECIES: RNA polymerase factor sigma-54 [Myxococcaceae]MBF5045035.1 RNA polymerase factor sigma-54 [Simulacricoccus sp. 17bor-14]MRI90777.1 RNA polymerase factor sigma-54 [Aggregicoccus sp. 17bor-14]